MSISGSSSHDHAVFYSFVPNSKYMPVLQKNSSYSFTVTHFEDMLKEKHMLHALGVKRNVSLSQLCGFGAVWMAA